MNLSLAELIGDSNFKTTDEVFTVLGIIMRTGMSTIIRHLYPKLLLILLGSPCPWGVLASYTYVREVRKTKVRLIGSVGQIQRHSIFITVFFEGMNMDKAKFQ